jgi:photosystem II stability/assembly factor-like uncharacterized protein
MDINKQPEIVIETPINTENIEKVPEKKQSINRIIIISVILLVILLLSALVFVQLRKPSENIVQNEVPDTSLSIIDQINKKYPGDVIDNQSFNCAPRNDDEWYRTDHSLAIDPKNSKVMYVNIEWKGVFKTIDGGKTWESKSKGIKAYAREDDPIKPCYSEYPTIKINPSDSNHLIIVVSGGGGGFLSLTEPNSQTGGIYQSFDAGESWKQMTGENMNIYSSDAVFTPNTGASVFYATSSAPASWQGSNQNMKYVNKGLILKTDNKGETWYELPTGIGERSSVVTLMINQSNSNEIVAPTFSAIRSSSDGSGTGISNGKDINVNQLGILKSIDGGATWSSIKDSNGNPYISATYAKKKFTNMYFIPFLSGNTLPFGHYTTDGITLNKTKHFDVVAYDPFDAEGKTVLGFSTATIGPANENLNLFRSIDAGKTWNKYGTLPKEVKNPQDRKTRISQISWDPIDKNTIYLNGANGYVWKSTDLGMSWNTLLSVDKIK